MALHKRSRRNRNHRRAHGTTRATISAALFEPLENRLLLSVASVAGKVYIDQNDNGQFDAGSDQALSNVVVTLTGTDDLGQVITPISQTSGIDGNYSFTDLRPGTYAVTESPAPYDLLDGLANPAGTLGGTVGQDRFTNIIAASGDNGANYNFGWLPPASVSGYVYYDANNNGAFNAGETGISGVLVTLTGTDDLGHSIAPQVHVIGNDGGYSFTHLRPGTYTVTEAQPNGYLDGIDTLGSLGGTVGQDQFTNVTLIPSANGVNYNFGEVLPASISGTVYLDINGNGQFDGVDQTLSGFTITLTGTDDLGHAVSPQQQVTDSSGGYTFGGLRPGTYTLTETEPSGSGFVDGTSTAGSVGAISLSPDQLVTNPVGSDVNAYSYNFGELPAPVINIVKTGPQLANAGTSVTYRYQVTDAGLPSLTNVSVTDDLAGTASPVLGGDTIHNVGDMNNDGKLDRGETWQFTATYFPGFTPNADLTSTATATGSFITTYSSGGNHISQAASAHANRIMHPFTLREDTFLYYSASNPANNVHYSLPDSNVYSVLMYDAVNAVVDSFQVSESTTQGIWLSDGVYTFVEDAPPAGYTAAVQYITYNTNGSYGGNVQTLINVPTFDLAMVMSGPTGEVLTGQTITYSYTITNSGPLAVAPTISDDVAGTPTYLSGDTNGDGLVEAGETWRYQSQYTVPTDFTAGWLTNTATVDDAANPHLPAGTIGGDINPANNVSTWTAQVSSIAIVRSGPTMAIAGSLLTFTYQVTDLRTTPVNDVAVFDDNAGFAQYVNGDVNGNGMLDPGETWTYSASATPTFDAAAAPLVITAYAFGDLAGQTVSAQASYTLTPFVLNNDLYLYHTASSAGNSSYNVHYNVVDNTPFTVQVLKDGEVVGQVQISESAPAEVWLSDGSYTFAETTTPAGYIPVTGSITYTTGTGSNSQTMINAPTFDLAVTNSGPASAKPGQTITFTYTVTNSGPAAVTPLLSDDVSGEPTYVSGDTNGDGLIEANETWVYQSQYAIPVDFTGSSIANAVTVDDAAKPLVTNGSILGGDTQLADDTAIFSVSVLQPTPTPSNPLTKGQTATIGFWHNKNGQTLINSLNGGSSSKALGNWLATTMADVFGASAGSNNLAGKTNSQIADFYMGLFKQTGQKLNAQFMAVALAVYSTNSTLAGGTYAAKYGFAVGAFGTGCATFNVGSNGLAFGLANNTTTTVLALLQAADKMAVKGVLYSGSTSLQNLANAVFDAINNTGDIS